MLNYLLAAFVFVLIVGCLFSIVRLGMAKPWQRRRHVQIMFWVYVPLGAGHILFGLVNLVFANRSLGILVVISGGLGFVVWSMLAFRPRSSIEEVSFYMHDPQHCGRCGYDLSGNTSGVCPECGWTLPSGSAKHLRNE